MNGVKKEAERGKKWRSCGRIWDRGGSWREWGSELKTSREREGKTAERRRRRAAELRDGEASDGGGGGRPWIPTSEIDFQISIMQRVKRRLLSETKSLLI